MTDLDNNLVAGQHSMPISSVLYVKEKCFKVSLMEVSCYEVFASSN